MKTAISTDRGYDKYIKRHETQGWWIASEKVGAGTYKENIAQIVELLPENDEPGKVRVKLIPKMDLIRVRYDSAATSDTRPEFDVLYILILILGVV